MDSNFYSNSNTDSDSGHEPNASGDLAIPILIPSHSDSHSDSGCESNTLLIDWHENTNYGTSDKSLYLVYRQIYNFIWSLLPTILQIWNALDYKTFAVFSHAL